MVYLIGPDGLVNPGFVNFHKMVWMTMVHVHRFRIWEMLIKCNRLCQPSRKEVPFMWFSVNGWAIFLSCPFWAFAHLQFTGYAEYIRFCHKEHLNNYLEKFSYKTLALFHGKSHAAATFSWKKKSPRTMRWKIVTISSHDQTLLDRNLAVIFKYMHE